MFHHIEVRVTPQRMRQGCPAGYYMFDGDCFSKSRAPATYSEAGDQCSRDGAQLATPNRVDFISKYFPREWQLGLSGSKWVKWKSNRRSNRVWYFFNMQLTCLFQCKPSICEPSTGRRKF